MQIIEYLRKVKSITSMEAMRDLGVGRLASRINDIRTNSIYQAYLREEGLALESRFITVFKKDGSKARVKEYYLENIRQ